MWLAYAPFSFHSFFFIPVVTYAGIYFVASEREMRADHERRVARKKDFCRLRKEFGRHIC